MQPKSDQSSVDSPAFTIRRHLLNVNEDNIQIEQMKKVEKGMNEVN
jgi:hypothetical protein